MLKKFTKSFALLLGMTALVGVGAAVALAAAPYTKSIDLLGVDGGTIGTAQFWDTPNNDGTLIRISLQGLTPGWHAVHTHAYGDCSDHGAGFTKSGGHIAEHDQTHGFLTKEGPHDGDLPNVWIHADGTGQAEFYTEEMEWKDFNGVNGSALMVHAGADDHATQPTGNTGARVACGVIANPRPVQ